MDLDRNTKEKLLKNKFFLIPKLKNKHFEFFPDFDSIAYNDVIKCLIKLRQERFIERVYLEGTKNKINSISGACISLQPSPQENERTTIGVQHTPILCIPGQKQNNMTLARAINLTMGNVKAVDVDNLHVTHACGNGRCINPTHLNLGSKSANLGYHRKYEGILKRNLLKTAANQVTTSMGG